MGGTAGSGTSSVEEPRASPVRMEGAQAAAVPERPGTERLVERPEEHQEVRFRGPQARIQTGGAGRVAAPTPTTHHVRWFPCLCSPWRQPCWPTPQLPAGRRAPCSARGNGPSGHQGLGGSEWPEQAGVGAENSPGCAWPESGSHAHGTAHSSADGCPNSWRAWWARGAPSRPSRHPNSVPRSTPWGITPLPATAPSPRTEDR